MRKRLLVLSVRLLGVATVLAAPGCGGNESRSPEVVDRRSPEVAVASADAICAEHGVLEAICTKCNPALAAVFRAKGDWCAEHGFPESVCPICHPERGGRPAVDVTSEAADALPSEVRLRSAEIAREAGIETIPATEGAAPAGLVVPATIVFDPARVARVNARAPGVVRAIRADLGARVRFGSPLVQFESAALGAERSRLQAAGTRVAVAEASYQREQELFEKGISSKKDVLAAQQELETAKAEGAAAQAELGMIGGSADGGGLYTLTSPIAGVVTERNATVGLLVGAEDVLFEIADVSTMWAEIAVREDQLSSVAVGQSVTIAVDGVPEREFAGTIQAIASKLDPRTRTATVRVVLRNPEGLLRANMFGRASIHVGGDGLSVLVPRESVQRRRGEHVVFVRRSDEVYVPRRVRVAPGGGEFVAIEGGVRPGDLVVTKGSFLLKTETLKESIGAGCCEAEAPKSGG